MLTARVFAVLSVPPIVALTFAFAWVLQAFTPRERTEKRDVI